MTRAVFTEETFKVFQLYEAHVHGKQDKSIEAYSRFLCESPLYDAADPHESTTLPIFGQSQDAHRSSKDIGQPHPQFGGSYHMVHRIDGEVAIVGVLDITKSALSSVYLYYDPKYEFLSPGTLAALKEIEYMRAS